MSISYNVVFNSVQNLVYPLNSGTVRIGATTAGSSGTLCTVSGVTIVPNTHTITWSLSGAPSFISINSVTGTVSFTGVTPADLSPNNVYNFSIVATDSSDSTNFLYTPITVEVLPNLYIKETGSLTTITTTSYVPVSNTIEGLGSDNATPLTGVKFIVPSSLPAGLNFRTDANNAYLYGNLQSVTNPRGGITQVGTGQLVTIQAYKEGTLYDHPTRAISLTLTYNVTAAAAGNEVVGLSGYADSNGVVSGNVPIRLHVRPDILSGSGDVTGSTSYTWTASGSASGSFLPSPNNTNSTVWVPSGSGTVTFSATVACTGTASPTYTTSNLTLNINTGVNWTASGALKLIPTLPSTANPTMEVVGNSGAVVTFNVDAIDIQVGETATLTATVTSLGGAPAASSPTVVNPSLTQASPTSDINFTIPAGAIAGQKYAILVNAATAANARVGNLQYYVVCSGAASVSATSSSTNVTIDTGTTYTTGTPLATLTPSTSGVTYNLVNAPAGLSVDQATGTIIGNVLTGGAGTFKVFVSKAGSTSTDSYSINYNINTPVTLISNLSLNTTTPTITPGSNLAVSWSYTGVLNSVNLQLNNSTPVNISSSTTNYTFTNLTTSGSVSLQGTNNVGEFFSVPLAFKVSSSGTVTTLPPSPTIATLDSNNLITVNWSPIPLGTDPANYYSDYLNWNIIYKINSGSEVIPAICPTTGLGTLDTRVAAFTLSSIPTPTDIVYLDMQGFSAVPASVLNSPRWDSMKAFPTVGSVSIDKTTAAIGEPIKVSFTNFIGDRWRIVFSDNTSTSWLPSTVTSTAITFNDGGVYKQFTVEFQNNYSTSAPSVRLSRVFTENVFINDVQYNPQGTSGVTGNLGLGGNAGFELTDATGGAVALQPYESIVKTLVKDEVTNELKLMVATARTQDASSLLGTMAVDVFPIIGRPHFKDLIKPVSTIITSNASAPVKIQTTILPNFIIGQYSTFNMIATGGTEPYNWHAIGLPQGLTLSSDGTLYGTVLALGSSSITFSVADSNTPQFIDETILDLTVVSDLTISTTALPSAVIGTNYNQQISITGGVGPFNWSVVGGQLPYGISIDPNLGILTGYPTTYNSTTDFSKIYQFVLQVVDSVGAIASKQYNLSLLPQTLTIGNPDQNVLYNGEKFRMAIPVYGGKSPYVTVTVSDTNGIVTSGNTSILGGLINIDIPETVAIGNYTFSVTVTDTATTSVTKNITYYVRPALGQNRIVDSFFDNFYNTTESADHYLNLNAIGGASVVLNTASPLSNGITLTYNDTTHQVDAKGPISSNTGGNIEVPLNFTVSGTTANGTISRVVSILGYTGAFTTVSPAAMTINLVPMQVGEFVTIDPERPYFDNTSSVSRNSSWTVALQPGKSLPYGLNLDANSGLIYGTIVKNDVTSTVIQYLDTNKNVVANLTINFNIIAAPKFTVTTSGFGTATRGTAYTGTIVANPPAVSPVTATLVKGVLPAGLSLTSSGNTVTLSGTPSEGGYYDLWIKVTDAANNVNLVYERLEISYSSALRITTNTLPLIDSGVPYSTTISAAGGVTPYSFALASGSPALPTGITLSSSGVLSGTTIDTNYNQPIIFQVTDNNATIVTKVINLVVDQGLQLSTSSVSGTDLGLWPQYETLSSGDQLTPLGYGTDYPFTSFMVRVAGLTGTNYALNGVPPTTSNSPFTFTTDKAYITGTLVDVRTEAGIQVGYVRLNLLSSAVTNALAPGSYSVTVTASDGSLRSKTATFTFTVETSTRGCVFKDSSNTTISSTITLNSQPAIGMLELNQGSLYISDGTLDANNKPCITIAGLNLNTVAIDPVQNGIIRLLNVNSALSGNIALNYDGPSTTGGAIVRLIFLGNTWSNISTSSTLPTFTIRVGEVAKILQVSGTNYKFDGYLGQKSNTTTFEISNYRDIKPNIYQIANPTITTYTTGIYVNQPYNFRINFNEPLNKNQNPTINVTGLQGVTSSTWVLDPQGRKIGYSISGLWPQSSLVTYPQVYTINAVMTENLGRIGDKVITSGVYTYFTQDLNVTVSVASNSLSITSLGSFGLNNQDVYGQNNSSVGGAAYPVNTQGINLYLNNAAGGTYKIKISAPNSPNTFYANSILNIPRELYLYQSKTVSGLTNSTFYTEADIAAAAATGGVSFTNVASGNNVPLCQLVSLPQGIQNSNIDTTLSGSVGSNYLLWPQPSVPSSTDYSSEANIIANALPIQNDNIVLNVTVTEVSTGIIANGVISLGTSPQFSSNWQYNPLIVATLVAAGSNSAPTFNVLGWYYDKANPSSYVSATYPDDGSGPYPIASTNGVPIYVYLFAASSFTTNNYAKFSNVTLQTANGQTIAFDSTLTSSSDPTISNIINYGAKIIVGNSSTSVSYGSWPFLGKCVNRYIFTPTATANTNTMYVDVYNGVSDTAPTPFAQWNTVAGNKAGYVKFKRLNIDIQVSSVNYCVDLDSDIAMADGTFKKAVDIKEQDKIISFNPIEQKDELDTVIKVIPGNKQKTYEFKLENGDSLVCSALHRLYVEDLKAYIEAVHIPVGYNLATLSGIPSKLISKEEIGYRDVITFTVENNMNYYSNGFRSHNKLYCCVEKGALVSMADGTFKAIEDLAEGDYVLSYDEETDTVTTDVVMARIWTKATQRISLKYGDKELISVPSHRYYTDLGWKDASEVYEIVQMNGSISLMNPDKIFIPVESATHYEVYNDDWVYLCELKKYHTLFIDGVLAHNIKVKSTDPSGTGTCY